jgi:hypothetical protein
MLSSHADSPVKAQTSQELKLLMLLWKQLQLDHSTKTHCQIRLDAELQSGDMLMILVLTSQ